LLRQYVYVSNLHHSVGTVGPSGLESSRDENSQHEPRQIPNSREAQVMMVTILIYQQHNPPRHPS